MTGSAARRPARRLLRTRTQQAMIAPIMIAATTAITPGTMTVIFELPPDEAEILVAAGAEDDTSLAHVCIAVEDDEEEAEAGSAVVLRIVEETTIGSELEAGGGGVVKMTSAVDVYGGV